MKEIFGLTRADRDLLDELHRRFGTLRENAPSARLPIDITDEPPQAPEVYIALVPSGGIPACEGTTGTGGPGYVAGDIPGHADCDIYRLVNETLYFTRKRQRVYNLAPTAISQQWAEVSREKYGIWVVSPKELDIKRCSSLYATFSASTTPDYILGLENGCLVLVSVTTCPATTGTP